jgi:hypothetical protein
MIERSYPGVYLSEVAFSAKPIDGVSTSTGLASAGAAASRIPAHTPEWTDHNGSDPGVTLVQLFGWLSESDLFRAQPHAASYAKFAATPWGVAQGLAVEAGHGAAPAVSVLPGLAIAGDGQPVKADRPTAAHFIHKP